MCSVQWMKRVRKGFWSCQVQQKCWRGAKLIWAVKGEDFMHCWPSSNVASDLMISPFKSLFLFRNHICRSIWFGSLRVSDHIKSVYYTGREAEVGWGRRARWRAKKWWWRTCSMLLLSTSPLIKFGLEVCLICTATWTLSTSKNDSGNWFHQLTWKWLGSWRLLRDCLKDPWSPLKKVF